MRNKGKAFCSVIFLIAALAPVFGGASAQNRQQPQVKTPTPTGGDTSVTPTILVSPDEDYRIGPRDVIEIKVDDAPELSITASVNADGTFLMPYLKRVTAGGKRTEDLSREIADGLRGRYLKDPSVLVSVKQFNSRAFFVLGAARRPGVYQIEGHPSLIKLITVAGGLAENHGSVAFILHEVKKNPPADAGPKPASAVAENLLPKNVGTNPDDEPEFVVRTVNISNLFRGIIPNEKEMVLEPGDIVNIPIADVFFVAGEVNAPGSFPLSEGTTLRQAVALSQGLTMNAASGKSVIFRQNQATGQRQEIPVDVGAVMKGKGDDVTILANDIVIIPNSKMKTIGNSLLKAVGAAGIQRGVYGY
ncbi:MAG TPA: polysaccharide biosynthesis/export family protein [Blastocatellia bacterium]|jgi:polysaccharide export outer membrane protein|nr:polysaccharide biosynthesis/export family protein [Blastocatellia bacterium]